MTATRPLLHPHVGRSMRAHRIFSSSSAQRTQCFFYFPIGKSSPHRFSSVQSSLLCFRRIGTCDFASSLLIARLSNPRDPIVGQIADFSLVGTSALSQLHSIATSLLTIPSPRVSNCQYPMHRNVDAILSHFRDSPPCVLVTWSSQYLGSHPVNSRVHEISRSLPPVFHYL
jgi:hypothetical protein